MPALRSTSVPRLVAAIPGANAQAVSALVGSITAAQNEAGAISPLNLGNPLQCDAVATYTVGPNASGTNVVL